MGLVPETYCLGLGGLEVGDKRKSPRRYSWCKDGRRKRGSQRREKVL